MLKKVALVVLSPIFVMLIVEIVLRVYFSVFGTQVDRVLYVYSADQILEENPAFIGLPLVGFGPSPAHPDHNALGFRHRETTIEKPEGVYRIITTGGSTTYGAGIAPNETWSAQLEMILHDDYGLDFIEVINTASVGYTTWNSLANLMFRTLDLEPDLLIIYHSTNDTKALLTDPTCYSGQSPVRGLGRGMWKESGPGMSPSTVVRYVGQRYGWEPSPVDFNAWILPVTWSDPQCEATDPTAVAEYLEANPPIYFERNVRNMVHLAHDYEIDVLLSTWAYHEDMIDQQWIPAHEANNQIMLQLADDMNTYSVDLMSELPVDESLWFFDGEHQNAKGSRLQAEFYAAYIAETIQPTLSD